MMVWLSDLTFTGLRNDIDDDVKNNSVSGSAALIRLSDIFSRPQLLFFFLSSRKPIDRLGIMGLVMARFPSRDPKHTQLSLAPPVHRPLPAFFCTASLATFSTRQYNHNYFGAYTRTLSHAYRHNSTSLSSLPILPSFPPHTMLGFSSTK